MPQKNKDQKKQQNEEKEIAQLAAMKNIITRFDAARKMRGTWESLWQECYDYTLPQRGAFMQDLVPGSPRTEKIYDATAMDAVDQLAASMLANLTPTWSQWFGLKPGPDLSDTEAQKLAPVLEKAAKTIQDHFDRSNFAVEIHQCYLDLIVGGTASISFEKATPGGFSAFRFSAVPLAGAIFEESESGYLEGVYRPMQMTAEQILERYPTAQIPAELLKKSARDPQLRFKLLEAVIPDGLAYIYKAMLIENPGEPVLLAEGRFAQSPFISFRWLKSPGEIYGRSPVMKALPDIKTANKVVELVPGSIIPKAVGSQGLQPLEMPGKFDISQIMLEGLQSRIRHALLADKLATVASPRMTATEVLERSAEMSLLLGATYGRLQSELLTPLIKRAFAILRRRGEVPDISLDGRFVAVDYRSPLARSQGQRNVQNTLSWINSVIAMGPEAIIAVDLAQSARFLGEALGPSSSDEQLRHMEGQRAMMATILRLIDRGRSQ